MDSLLPPGKVGYKWKQPRHRTAGILFAYTLTLEQVQKYKYTCAYLHVYMHTYVLASLPGARALFKANISHLALRLNKFSMNTLKLFL